MLLVIRSSSRLVISHCLACAWVTLLAIFSHRVGGHWSGLSGHSRPGTSCLGPEAQSSWTINNMNGPAKILRVNLSDLQIHHPSFLLPT